jgi:beta-glucosidase
MREPLRFRPTAWERLEARVLPSSITGWIPPSAVIPLERTDAYALERHAEDLAEARQATANVVFLGDSITDFWGDGDRNEVGTAVWDQWIAPLGAANFGVSGDTTENVLWRVENGELAGQPKVVVLEIGTNNLGVGNSVSETVAGISAVVSAIRTNSPGSQILLLGIFPRGAGVTDPLTQEAYAVNGQISALADGVHVHYLNIGSIFLTPLNTISRALMPDGLHPSAAGYQLWAETIVGPLQSLIASTFPPASPTPAQTPTPAPSPAPGTVTPQVPAPLSKAAVAPKAVEVADPVQEAVVIVPESYLDTLSSLAVSGSSGGQTARKRALADAWSWVLSDPGDGGLPSV